MKTFTVAKMKRNIRKAYDEANATEIANGMTWYARAHEFALYLSAKYGITLEQAAGVLSALSPSSYWDRNMADAERLIANPVETTKVSTYGKNKFKSLAILRDTGRDTTWKYFDYSEAGKTYSFYRNIENPAKNLFVTIDRFALGIAHGKHYRTVDKLRITPAMYREVSQAYHEVARELALHTHQVQAITWLRVHRTEN